MDLSLVGPDGWLGMVCGFVYVGPQGDVYETGFADACRSDGKLRVVGTEKNNYMI
jgi:hypothetical protein